MLGAINVPWDVFRMPWAFIWCLGIPHHTALWAASYREKPAEYFIEEGNVKCKQRSNPHGPDKPRGCQITSDSLVLM